MTGVEVTHGLVRRQQLISARSSRLRYQLDSDGDALLLPQRVKGYRTWERNVRFSAQAVGRHRCLTLSCVCFTVNIK